MSSNDMAPPPRPAGSLAAVAGDRGRAALLREWAPALLHLLAFGAVYLLAVWTPLGQRTENALFAGADAAGGESAWVWDLSGPYGAPAALPPLGPAALPTLLVGLALLAGVAAAQRRWWQGAGVLVSVLATFGAAEVLAKRVLPRPELAHASLDLLAPSFPSGHVVVPAALTVGVALVAPARARGPVVAAGTVWVAFAAAAVLATYQHRPSDALGATLLACAVFLVTARLLPRSARSGEPSRSQPLAAVTLVLSAVAALVGGARTDSVAESLVFAATGLACAALVWFAAERGTAPRGPLPARGR